MIKKDRTSLQNYRLPDSYADSLIALRKELHQNAELSGKEEKTRQIVFDFISRNAPHKIISPIGGNGIACIYQAEFTGPALLFRAEMDALPIEEKNDLNYKSQNSNVSHSCGHDGQMAILAGLSGLLHKNPLKRGKVILLFQPAEETGQGAITMISDPKFKQLRPDYVFALHNMPGEDKGTVSIGAGVFNCASVGMIIRLAGKTA
ncbi:MAG: M20/M25/M40 family metallo-hydrolase, partial [Deltaproteobacteria bacterium]